MFRSYDHLQGTTLFFAKVTFLKCTHRFSYIIILFLYEYKKINQ